MLQKLKNVLKTIDIDSDIIDSNLEMLLFKVKNLNYLVQYSREDDPTYVRVSLPKIFQVEKELDPQLISAIMQINSEYKVGKIIQIDEFLWVTADTFFLGEQSLQFFVMRTINLLEEIYKKFNSIEKKE